MNYLFIWCNDDGEVRVVLKDSETAAEYLAGLGRTVITEPPETDPSYWPEGVVYVAAVMDGMYPGALSGAS